MLKKLFLSLFLIFIAVLSIALYRTIIHTAPDLDGIQGEVISIDELQAAQNLAESIRFKTISYQDEDKFPHQEFNKNYRWAEVTNPEFHEVMEIDQLKHS